MLGLAVEEWITIAKAILSRSLTWSRRRNAPNRAVVGIALGGLAFALTSAAVDTVTDQVRRYGR